MENQQEHQPKLLDDLPTFVANDQTKYDLDLADLTTFKVDVGGDHHDQQQQQQPTKQTEVAKADAAPAPPEPSETSVLDMANPDLFVIGQPSSQNFVDLDFDLNPPPPPPTVNTDAPVTAKDSSIITATTNGDAADAELSAITSTTTNGDDWSTFETHSQPTITAAELQFAKSSSSSLANESLANITCVENTSCIDSLLSDLPEETFVEDENIGSGNNKSQNNDKSDLDWSSSDYKEEVVTAPSVVAFEPSKPEEVVLPPPTKEEDTLPSPSPPPSPQPMSTDISTGSGDQLASTVVPDVVNTSEGSGGDDSTVPTFEAAITTTEKVAVPVAVEEVAAPAAVAEEVAAPAPLVEEIAAPAVAKEVAAAAVVAEEEAKEEEPLLLSANDRDTDDHLAAADNTPPVVVAKQQQQQDSSLTETQAEAVETAASASATESPNTRLQEQQQQPLPSPSPVSFSQSSSASPPDTASAPLSTAAAATTKTDTTTATTTTTMGRKNQSYRRENSNDEAESSGPDQVKEYIETVLGPNVAELVYWRDVKNSGVVFGAGLVILFSLSIFSVISVVAYTLLFTLLGTLSFRIYKNVMQAVNKTNEGHPFKEYLEIEIAPPQERIHEIVDSVVAHGTCFINRMRSVLLVEDLVDSLKYLLIFWALTYIGACFNGLTLILLAYLGAFSLPIVYEQNKAQIDQYLDLVSSKISEISDKVPFLKKVPTEKKEE